MALFSIQIYEKMGNRQHQSRVLKLFSIFPHWIFFYVITHLDLIQKQPPEMFCKKRCSQKFHKIHKKTPVPESLFNKVGTGILRYSHTVTKGKLLNYGREKNCSPLVLCILYSSVQCSACSVRCSNVRPISDANFWFQFQNGF